MQPQVPQFAKFGVRVALPSLGIQAFRSPLEHQLVDFAARFQRLLHPKHRSAALRNRVLKPRLASFQLAPPPHRRQVAVNFLGR